MKMRYYCFAAIGKGLPSFMEYPSLGKAKTEYVNLVHGRQDVYLSPYIIGRCKNFFPQHPHFSTFFVNFVYRKQLQI